MTATANGGCCSLKFPTCRTFLSSWFGTTEYQSWLGLSDHLQMEELGTGAARGEWELGLGVQVSWIHARAAAIKSNSLFMSLTYPYLRPGKQWRGTISSCSTNLYSSFQSLTIVKVPYFCFPSSSLYCGYTHFNNAFQVWTWWGCVSHTKKFF